MESIRSKRRGFMKSKLVMPFYKAPKPTTTTTSSTTTTLTSTTTDKVVKPSHYSPTVSSKGYVVSSSMKDHAAVTVINPQPIKSKKVSFMSTVPCDDAVDLKAANYISCVQERFRLQRLNSERRIGNMVPQDAQ